MGYCDTSYKCQIEVFLENCLLNGQTPEAPSCEVDLGTLSLPYLISFKVCAMIGNRSDPDKAHVVT